MKNFFALTTFFLCSLTWAGDLKDRFRDRDFNSKSYVPLTTANTLGGVLEVAVPGGVVFGTGTLAFFKETDFEKGVTKRMGLRKSVKITAKNLGKTGTALLAAVGIDGLTRLYLLEQGKEPTLLPLAGLVAHVIEKTGSAGKKVLKISATSPDAFHKLPENLKSKAVVSANGSSELVVDMPQAIVDSVSETLRSAKIPADHPAPRAPAVVPEEDYSHDE